MIQFEQAFLIDIRVRAIEVRLCVVIAITCTISQSDSVVLSLPFELFAFYIKASDVIPRKQKIQN